MKRISRIFTKQSKPSATSQPSQKKTDDQLVVVTDKEDDEQTCLMYGVSLAHLVNLPVPHDETFNAACNHVKEQTKNMTGYRSYARWLKTNPETRHLVRDQATVFVSYAWSGGFGKTMDALKDHFKDMLEETFVWMDFSIVDQHKAATTNIDFDQWAKTFGESLKRIGQACLVLTPGEKPIAISRSWCCFEWTTIAQSNIPFSYSVPSEDERKIIAEMKDGIARSKFNDLFAGINVENARAFKESDQQAILALMRKTGVIAVNDIVMKSLKQWLVQLAVKAVESSSPSSFQMYAALNARASLHDVLGELDDAVEYFQKALDCAKQLANDEAIPLPFSSSNLGGSKKDAMIATSVNNLGAIYLQKGDAKAEALLREGLDLSKKVLGNNHPVIATALNNLASLLEVKRDYEAAEPLYRESLAITKALYDSDHEDIALCYNNLAGLHYAQDDYDKAEPLFREALAMRKRLLGDNHTDVAQSLNNLAELYSETGQSDAAEPLYLEALAIRKKILGENHPGVADLLSNLAGLYLGKEDYKAAEPLYRQALAINKAVYGESHREVAADLHQLATVLSGKEDYAGAESMYREALAIRRKLFGDSSLEVASTLNYLGSLLQTKSDLIGAEKVYREDLAIRTKLYGDNHPDVAQALHNLAGVLQDKKELVEAIQLFKQSLDLKRAGLGDSDPDVADSLYWLASAEKEFGQREDALKHAKEALTILEEALGSEHPNTQVVLSLVKSF